MAVRTEWGHKNQSGISEAFSELAMDNIRVEKLSVEGSGLPTKSKLFEIENNYEVYICYLAT